MRLALIPAAPVLVAGVDLSEPRVATETRQAIAEVLAASPTWALPVDTLPVLLGLGGYGIDRGLDTRTGALLEGAAWVEAVADLDEAERRDCLAAHPGLAIAALHAHGAGVSIGPRGTSDAVLVPIDLSAAATPDAPLAPVEGAPDFDTCVVEAIRSGDRAALGAAVDTAVSVHADLDLLGAALDDLEAATPASAAFDSHLARDVVVHEVRSVCAVIGA